MSPQGGIYNDTYDSFSQIGQGDISAVQVSSVNSTNVGQEKILVDFIIFCTTCKVEGRVQQ